MSEFHDLLSKIMNANTPNKVVEEELVPSTPKRWVSHWLDKQGIVIDYKNRVRWGGRILADLRRVSANMQEDYFTFARAANIPGPDRFRKEDLVRGLELCIQDIQESAINRVIENLAYRKDADPDMAELRRFSECICGTGEASNFAFIMLHHFLWQVKRKMADMPVEHHMMIILRGDQGCGKTQSLSRFLSPIIDYTYEGPISIVQDKNEMHNFHDNYVFRSEELERLDKTDKNALKRMITEEQVSYRVMYSQCTSVNRQRCTFIGTSNDHLADIFVDHTGMRRFAQIDTLPTEEFKLNWGVINSIDYVKIWRSVSERSKPPVLKILASGELGDHQETLRAKTQFEQWLSDVMMQPGDRSIPVQCLYVSFKNWCKTLGRNPPNMSYFSRSMEKEGFIKHVMSIDNKQVPCYMCNQDSIPQ